MTVNLDKKGLKSIINNYDFLYIDIWGVLHNGITLYKDAVDLLDQLEIYNKEYVLLTNAPRPNNTVINFLKKMGLEKSKSSKVYTSGEAALNYLSKKLKSKKFFHLGPPRDFDLFKFFQKNKVKKIEDAEFLLCTGLFDNYQKLDFYKLLLSKNIKKNMVCTNPDLVVDRGNKREFCAGSVAKEFEKIGGKVIYFGKPFPLIYKLASKKSNKRVLCIGDNLNTDIKGANNLKFSSLFISGGIHKNESKSNLNKLFSSYNVKVDYIQSKLKW